jgi:hypothetical protein
MQQSSVIARTQDLYVRLLKSNSILVKIKARVREHFDVAEEVGPDCAAGIVHQHQDAPNCESSI